MTKKKTIFFYFVIIFLFLGIKQLSNCFNESCFFILFQTIHIILAFKETYYVSLEIFTDALPFWEFHLQVPPMRRQHPSLYLLFSY